MAQVIKQAVVERGVVAENLYVAGKSVDVQADVGGDLLVAGEYVVIGGAVKRDIAAVGREVTLQGGVGADAQADGEAVTPDGRIGGEAVAAAGGVLLARTGQVAGKAWLAGGTIEVQGSVGKWLQAT